MDVNTLFGAKNFAVETRDAMFDEFQDRDQLAVLLFHVNDVGGAYGITKSAAGAFVQIDINYHARLRS
jgi:hypothetical protein